MRRLSAIALALWAGAAGGEERRFALVAGAPDGGPGTQRLRYAERDARRIHEILLRLGLSSYWKASVLWLRPAWWISANDATLAEEERRFLASAPPVDVLASRIDAIMRFDRRARLGEIRVPTLVQVSEDDVVTPKFYSEELAARIPGAKLAVLQGGGHFAPEIVPAAYNAVVGTFLREQLRS